jgi:phosphate transport system substrate-binding protein
VAPGRPRLASDHAPRATAFDAHCSVAVHSWFTDRAEARNLAFVRCRAAWAHCPRLIVSLQREYTLRSSKRRLVWLVALLAAAGLVAGACGSDSDSSSDTTSSPSTAGGETSDVDFESLSGTLNGSGATFPSAFYEEAIGAFADVGPGLTVNYNAVGSGQGKKDLAAGTSDWAGSDSLVKDEEKATFKGPFLYFPTVAAPITVSYNLDGVDELHLSPATLAKIFMGEITTWDDAAIAAENEGVELPSEAITVAVRADGSGTTSNFSKYLKAAAPEVFTLESGDTVAWPKATSGNGNSGVAQIVKDTAGAIGYVDLSDANATGLSFAAIQNKDGEYVLPTLEGASAALAGAEVKSDLSYSPLNASGAEAYPITAPTFVLVYTTYSDATMVTNIQGWLTYLLTDAQDLAADVDFAKLPDELREKALAQIDEIKVG